MNFLNPDHSFIIHRDPAERETTELINVNLLVFNTIAQSESVNGQFSTTLRFIQTQVDGMNNFDKKSVAAQLKEIQNQARQSLSEQDSNIQKEPAVNILLFTLAVYIGFFEGLSKDKEVRALFYLKELMALLRTSMAFRQHKKQ